MARHIVEEAIEAAIAAGNRETGTLLLGRLIEDRALLAAGAASAWALVVTEQVDVPEGAGTTASYVYPPEAFRRARALADLRGRGELVVGSQHSHGWRCRECTLRCEIRNLFFSSYDEVMARQFPVYAAHLVVGGDPARERERPVADLFVRLQGAMRRVAFALFHANDEARG